jgi:hypothetical protein
LSLSSFKRADSIFDAKPAAVTWHTKRSASNENMIAPEQEKSMAKQINAAAIVLSSSHVAVLSHLKKSQRSSKPRQQRIVGSIVGTLGNVPADAGIPFGPRRIAGRDEHYDHH